MINVVVDYQNIINTIKKQFMYIQANNSEFAGINFDVGDEQFLAKSNMDSPNFIYILVRFGQSTINFGVAVVNITLEVLGLNNEIELTQMFLNTYVNTYNRATIGTTTQLYLTPTVSTNMNPVYAGLRSLFIISGSIILDNNLIKLNELRFYPDPNGNEYEVIECLSFSDQGDNDLNPQPYSNTQGRAKSHGNFQTLGFSIVTYPNSSSALIQRLWANKYDFSQSHANDTFAFKFSFTGYNNGQPSMLKEFKLKICDFNQKIGETPVINATFIL